MIVVTKEGYYRSTFIGIFENKDDAVKQMNYFDPNLDLNEYKFEELKPNSLEQWWISNKSADLLRYYFPILDSSSNFLDRNLFYRAK